jgi:hypothetical protein
MGLAAIGLLERLLVARLYGPIEFGDTPTYFRLARVLAESGFSSYDATRVPGYPMFIGLMGQDQAGVWLAQLGLGLIISLLLFQITWRLTQVGWLAFGAGMLYNLTAGLFLFEFNLLSETLTSFLLLLSMTLFLEYRRVDELPLSYLLAFFIGLSASLTGLVRTMFFFLPVILLPFVMWKADSWRQRLQLGFIFSLAPVLLLGGWIYFVYDHYGMLSPTTMGGYHLVQHTGAFFERLPDSEATIRDIYLRYRDERLAARGVQTNTIWDAIPELSQATGLSFFALSDKLQALSIQLIRENPWLYLGSVLEGWISFWKAPVYWSMADFAAPAAILRIWSLIGRALAVVANGAFLALSALSIISRKLRRRLKPPPFILASAVFILFSSVLQTVVDHGDNPRFLVPLQMLVIVLVIWAIWKLGSQRIGSG